MLEWVVSGSVLIAVVIALRFALRGKISLRLQYAMWALVLVRLLVPVSLGESSFGVAALMQKAAGLQDVGAKGAVVQEGQMPAGGSAGEVQEAVHTEGAGEGSLPAAAHGQQAAVGSLSSEREEDAAGDMFKAVWLTGTVLLGLVLLASNARFAVTLRKSRRRLEGVSCRLPVYVSPQVDTPCLFGLLTPAIYVTPEAAGDEVAFGHAVEHELTHFRHGDHIWALLRGACLAVHWYNPMVWWAAVLSLRDAELACDEATIRRLGESERARYGRTLIGLTCQKRRTVLLTATTMTGGRRGLEERIRLIAQKPKTAGVPMAAALLILAVAAGCTFTGPESAGTQVPPVEMEVAEDLPQAVTDYARDYTQHQLDYYANELGYEITRATVTGLTQINTGTAGLDNGVNMYLLEYRFLAADPDEIVLAGGMKMEEGCITEWGSVGQPYLVLRWNGREGERTWQPVCVTNTESITTQYGTPEMLQQYGDMYTAAAMELAFGEEGFVPGEAVEGLFAPGDVTLTLSLDDGGEAGSYSVGKGLAARFEVLLCSYEWTALETLPEQPGSFQITALSADGTKSITVWEDGGAGVMRYTDGGTQTLWAASPLQGGKGSIARDLRGEYDNLDADCTRIAFEAQGGAQQAAETFVRSVYGEHMATLAPGNMYGMDDYEVIRWEVREVSEQGDAVVGSFECAFTPWDADSPGIWAGNTGMGTGEYEGKLTYQREFVLQKQEDGLWHCVGLGTGGYSLPE